MTYKQALKELKRQVKCWKNGISFSYKLQPLESAVSALEKQIPKKPYEDKYPWAICPTCGGSVSLTNVQEHIENQEVTYCEHCGQALDWGDNDDR